MTDLPQEIQNKESATFDFGTIRTLLQDGYFRGPAIHDDDSHKGLRKQSLRGDPSSHRKSILGKATDTNILKQTPKGYATTQKGYNLLQDMMICDNCGTKEESYVSAVRRGQYSGSSVIHTNCPSCDNPLSATNTDTYTRSNDRLEEAVDVMEAYNVVCYLNDKTIDQVKKDLGL